MAPLGSWDYYPASTAPRLYDIALCRFPFHENPDDPPPRRSPCLVRRVRLHKSGEAVFVQVAFGTSNLKTTTRMGKDLILMNAENLNRIGLAKATRFDVQRCADLPWCKEWFPIPEGYFTPILGRLQETNIATLKRLVSRNC